MNQSVEDHRHRELSAEKRRNCITFPFECWERALSEKRLCTDALRWAAAHTALTVIKYPYQQRQLTTRHCPLSEDGDSPLIGGLGARATPTDNEGLKWEKSSCWSSLRMGHRWWLNEMKTQNYISWGFSCKHKHSQCLIQNDVFSGRCYGRLFLPQNKTIIKSNGKF